MLITQGKLRPEVLAAIVALFAGAPVSFVHAEEAADAPAFLHMHGAWESVALKAEPPAVLEAMPALAAVHRIVGSSTVIQPGVRFLVAQDVDGETLRTELTYVHDAAASKSFGVIADSNGGALRAVIEHHAHQDILRLYDSHGNIVWTDRNVWASPDLLKTEASFMFEGREARVWFETRRATN